VIGDCGSAIESMRSTHKFETCFAFVLGLGCDRTLLGNFRRFTERSRNVEC
jgi:hypothetical protein